MIFLIIYSIISSPIYKKSGNHLEIYGNGEVTSSDIKTKSQYDKMETCSILSNITSIGTSAFSGCTSLVSIDLPDSLLSIYSSAFSGTKLKSLRIPKNVNKIEVSYTFKSYDFELFDVDKQNNFFSVYDNVLYNKDQTILCSCPHCKTTIDFSNNLTIIGSFAFWVPSISKMHIPDSVIALNSMSFVDSGIEISITFGMGSQLKSITSHSFWMVNFAEFVTPPSVTQIEANAFYYTKIKFFSFMGESNLTHIKENSFISCTNLERVSLPKSIQSISSSAFTKCTNLQFVMIEDGCQFYKSSSTGSILKADLSEIIFIPLGSTSVHIYNETKTIASSILQKLTQVPIENVTIEPGNSFISYANGIFYTYDFVTANNALGSVENVVIDSRTKTLSASLFSGIENLRSVSFESNSSCLNIGGYCFENCQNLASVTLPDTISFISSQAFRYSGIQFFTIPRDLRELNSYTFDNCKQLTTLNASFDCKLTLLSGNCFSNCGIINVSLPRCLKEIQAQCFINNKISEITFPKSLQTISSSAFENVPLTKITFEDEINLTAISTRAFYGCNVAQIVFPKSLTVIESSAFCNCKFLIDVQFESGCKVEDIPSSTFEGCILLQSFPIVPSIKRIDASSFLGCFNLTTLTIEEPEINRFTFENGGLYDIQKQKLYLFPPGIKSGKVIPDAIEILNNAFYGDSILENLAFDEGSRVEIFGKDTFYGCSSIKSLILPSSLRNISDNCFRSCTSLSSVIFRDGSLLQSIGSKTFEGCKELTTIEFGEESNLELIGESSFSGCSKLRQINFPVNIQTIGASAFSDCTSLESVAFDISESNHKAVDIPESCFARCTNLFTVDLPSFIRSIGSEAFIDCKSLNYLSLHEGLSSIGERAFMGSGLPHADLPSSVTEIMSQAFSSSADLRCVILRCRSGLKLKSNCFSLCEKLKNISFCAETQIDAESLLFQGSNNVAIYALKSYPAENIGGVHIYRVMDHCMVFPSVHFTIHSTIDNQYGLLFASIIDSEAE